MGEYDNLSSEEIGNLLAEEEKELSKDLKAQQVVEEEILMLSRQILEMQLKKRDLQVAKSKVDYIVKQHHITLRVMRNKFFSVRNEGR